MPAGSSRGTVGGCPCSPLGRRGRVCTLVTRGRARGSRGAEPQGCVACLAALLAVPVVGASAAGSAGDSPSGRPVVAGASCPNVVNAARFHQQGTAAKDDREVQQLRSARPGQPGPQQGDRLAGEEGPRDRAQRPLTGLQALRLVPAHRFQARTRSRHRRGGRAQRDPIRWVEGERPRRGSGSLVQADLEERRGRPPRLSRAGSGDHRRECGGQGGRSRFPDRFASLGRGASAHRAVPDARPRGLHGLLPAVPRHAA